MDFQAFAANTKLEDHVKKQQSDEDAGNAPTADAGFKGSPSVVRIGLRGTSPKRTKALGAVHANAANFSARIENQGARNPDR